METQSPSPECFLANQPCQFRDNVSSARQFLRTQKIILTAIQPNHRSFSYPDLRTDLIDDFKLFRNFFFCHDFLQKKVNAVSTIKQDLTRLETRRNTPESNEIDRPVPMPRKTGHQRKQASSVTPSDTEDTQTISASCDDTRHLNLTPVAKGVNYDTETCDPSYSAFKPPSRKLFLAKQSSQSEGKDSKEEAVNFSNHMKHHNLSETSFLKTPIKIKTKNSFRSFLKIKNITSNKFLSLRLSRNGISERSLFRFHNELSQACPKRPVRTPPPPPTLHFRPLCPLPEITGEPGDNKLSPDRTNCLRFSEMSYLSDDISELYHDSAIPEDDIYSSVDESLANCSRSHLELVNEETMDNKQHFSYDDSECIYQELSSSSGTIYEEFDDNIYDNVEVVEDELEFERESKKHMKQQQKMEKIMKRFSLNGNEIPVNAGIVKENQKGSKSDLLVRKGETVLILRMENNPPGKWLAKSERSKIGYIDLDNVFLEADNIKAMIQSFHNFSS